MTDTVAAAYISVAGAVIVAIAGAVTQLGITRSVIRAERERVRQQLVGEDDSRRAERRENRLLDAVADLIQAADPDGSPAYARAVLEIQRIQLLLDLRVPAHKALNDSVNRLGMALDAYRREDAKTADSLSSTRSVLQAQSEVIEAARHVIHGAAPAAS